MKYLLSIIIILILPVFVKAQLSLEHKGIAWSTGTWEDIKLKAKNEKKLIFVDAFATWCIPCKKMDKEVFTDQKVGEIVNSKFVSVKVQMDQTSSDKIDIKVWYPIASHFQQQYKPEGYPCFLFFAPDGRLIHRGTGMQSVEKFINLAKEAISDPSSVYESDLRKFNSGGLDFQYMPKLAEEASKRKEKQTSIAIAKKFKEEYLDKINEKEAFTKDNLSFLADFYYELIDSKDKYFQFFFHHSEQADSIINRIELGEREKIAAKIVLGIIRKEEIKNKVYKNGRPITYPKPDWKKIQWNIENKYGVRYAEKLFPDEQIVFYQSADDWNNYANYINKKIKKIPPQRKGKLFGPRFGDAWYLNFYTWILFENCNNKRVLKKGLPWIDLSLRLEESGYSLDTKANLLYRMGKVKKAIELQQRAIALSKNDKAIIENLGKMKAGLATWRTK